MSEENTSIEKMDSTSQSNSTTTPATTTLKKVIVLAGFADSGKTSVLCKLLGKLKGGPIPIGKNLSDVKENVRYKAKSGRWVEVGVSSSGDDLKSIHDSFDFFKSKNCEIGILACRVWQTRPCDKNANSLLVEKMIGEVSLLGLYPLFVWKCKTDKNDSKKIDFVDKQTVEQLYDMI